MDRDVAQFRFLSDNERYADLINGAVFGGRQRKDGKVNMCKALTELINDGRQEGREEGIRVMILDNLDQGKSGEEILEKLQRYYSLSGEQAEGYLKKVSESLRGS